MGGIDFGGGGGGGGVADTTSRIVGTLLLLLPMVSAWPMGGQGMNESCK